MKPKPLKIFKDFKNFKYRIWIKNFGFEKQTDQNFITQNLHHEKETVKTISKIRYM